jgi:Tat protein secretion system quality control protein TatD with DNase activity
MQVLVLHCRGPMHQDPTATYTRLQALLVKARVPVQQRIHLHCFNGSRAVVDNWSLVFPGTKFGFTLLVRSFDDQQKDALRALEPSQILVETDAPYFTSPGYEVTTPALIGIVVEAVARLRGETCEQVFRASVQAARDLYLN